MTLLRIHNVVAAICYVENADPQKPAETLDELLVDLPIDTRVLYV